MLWHGEAMTRMTEFDTFTQSPVPKSDRDTLAVYRGIHELLGRPTITTIRGDQFSVTVTRSARRFWQKHAKPGDVPLLPLQLTCTVPSSPTNQFRHGIALTFWVATDRCETPQERPDAEAKSIGRMEAFAHALALRYNMPLAMRAVLPRGNPPLGHGLMGIAFVTDAAHARILSRQLLPAMRAAYRACDKASTQKQVKDTVLSYFPPAPAPVPAIDTIRHTATLMEKEATRATIISPEINALLIRDYIRDKTGQIEVAHTLRDGTVEVHAPIAAQRLARSRPTTLDLPTTHPEFADTHGLMIWFDPHARPGGRARREHGKQEYIKGTQPEMLFVAALKQRFNIELEAHPVYLPQNEERGLPSYGLLLRTSPKHETTLLEDVRKELLQSFHEAQRQEREEARLRPPRSHPRIASSPEQNTPRR